MRTLVATTLTALACALAVNAPLTGQDAKQPDKKPKGKFDPPKAVKPDADTLKQIADKTEQLRKAVEALKAKKLTDDVFVEVAIYLKAAENIVRFEEWFNAASGKWALQTLDQGLERAKQAESGKAVWRDAPGKWVVRAYRSRIDDSIQPYAVLLPHDYGKDAKKKWRLDVVLHGRDGSLTEAKFIASHGTAAKEAPKDRDFVQLEVYGRGNNAYRWAGETDVHEAVGAFAGVFGTTATSNVFSGKELVDAGRVVLRGFSMGGAGTWHIGLHHPSKFCVIGPGAGFTNTHGYIANLPKELPDYQEKCLRIYDAVDYAENAFNVPVVAYSGEKDAQKKAADNIENALKGFKEPLRFTHLVAPGLEHQMPPEWQAKAEAEYKKYADKPRESPARVRFVTYTPRYGACDRVWVAALERTYEKAVVDASWKGNAVTVTTSNVRRLVVVGDPDAKDVPAVTLDGQAVEIKHAALPPLMAFQKAGGKWSSVPGLFGPPSREQFPRIKFTGQQGPIDDAFTDRFLVFKPAGGFGADLADRFAAVWDRYFRGTLPASKECNYPLDLFAHTVLFGDPQSNPIIKDVLPKLPITWTKDELVVDGVKYDAKTHLPVLIYPNPLNPDKYVVINSGHTFKEADLKGTNALLYPRLGDWAVIKPTPTDKDPAGYEVVAAGLFDENWQFPKKK